MVMGLVDGCITWTVVRIKLKDRTMATCLTFVR